MRQFEFGRLGCTLSLSWWGREYHEDGGYSAPPWVESRIKIISSNAYLVGRHSAMLDSYSALSVRGYWCWVIKKHVFNLKKHVLI